MNATQRLHDLGQSLWLDNITRDLLDSGTLKRYIDDLSVTGLTSNPTIFDHAIKSSAAYDTAIRKKPGAGTSADALFFELALEDLGRAADLFRPIHDQTDGVDGWVSLEVSPLLAYDTASTLVAAKALFARATRPNLLIKIPGTREGLPAIEEAIFAGVPVNVTLLFSREHYLAAAEAFPVSTMPEGTLNALADHGDLAGTLPADGGDCEDVLARFARAGIDIDALAARLQDEGARSFVKSWNELMAVIAGKRAALAKAS